MSKGEGADTDCGCSCDCGSAGGWVTVMGTPAATYTTGATGEGSVAESGRQSMFDEWVGEGNDGTCVGVGDG